MSRDDIAKSISESSKYAARRMQESIKLRIDEAENELARLYATELRDCLARMLDVECNSQDVENAKAVLAAVRLK